MTSETGPTGPIEETGPTGPIESTGATGPIEASGPTGPEYGVCYHFTSNFSDLNQQYIVNTVSGIAIRVFPNVTQLTDLPSNWKEVIYDVVASYCAVEFTNEYFTVDVNSVSTKIGCVTLVDMAYIGDESYYDFVSR